mmetsp:Transcript_57569/g.67209  ORF Transcript_57569/g.67209 Transcript_57569/m.67209 type:complete len:213 (-) Transcript_57569:283-921(-)
MSSSSSPAAVELTADPLSAIISNTVCVTSSPSPSRYPRDPFMRSESFKCRNAPVGSSSSSSLLTSSSSSSSFSSSSVVGSSSSSWKVPNNESPLVPWDVCIYCPMTDAMAVLRGRSRLAAIKPAVCAALITRTTMLKSVEFSSSGEPVVVVNGAWTSSSSCGWRRCSRFSTALDTDSIMSPTLPSSQTFFLLMLFSLSSLLAGVLVLFGGSR